MKRQQIAEFYSHELRETPLSLPSMSSDIGSAWHVYVIRSEQRDYLLANLSEDKIDTVIHYPTPPHCQKAYSEFSQATEQLPITEKIKKEVDEAKKTFKKYGWPVVDVTRKSVEETAASILKIFEINKNK